MIIRDFDAYTDSKTSDNINVDPEKGFQVHVYVSNVAGETGSIIVAVDGKVPTVTNGAGNSLWYNLITSASMTKASQPAIVTLAVGPGITAVTNLSAHMYTPQTVRVTITAADANPLTYAVVTTP